MGRVLVAGGINMDVVAEATRYPRIGETVLGTAVHFFPGGKGANQAVAAARLGAATTLIACLGQDTFGGELRGFLASQGVDLRHIREVPEAQTGTAVITLADADNAIVGIPGANALLGEADVRAPPLAAGDVLVSQFETPLPALHAFFSRARPENGRTIFNAAPPLDFERALLRLVDILVLNESELSFFTGAMLRESDPPARFIEAARLLRASPAQAICVTLGKRGAVALVDGETLIIPGRAVEPVDTTGAGDCFVGALAARIAAGAAIGEALQYANAAASLCVQRMGAGSSMPTHAEVAAALEQTSA